MSIFNERFFPLFFIIFSDFDEASLGIFFCFCFYFFIAFFLRVIPETVLAGCSYHGVHVVVQTAQKLALNSFHLRVFASCLSSKWAHLSPLFFPVRSCCFTYLVVGAFSKREIWKRILRTDFFLYVFWMEMFSNFAFFLKLVWQSNSSWSLVYSLWRRVLAHEPLKSIFSLWFWLCFVFFRHVVFFDHTMWSLSFLQAQNSRKGIFFLSHKCLMIYAFW